MTNADKAIHDRVAHYIAETRFPFPDQTDWPQGYTTIVNAGNPQAAVKFRHHEHAPDILVIDERQTPREIGEVEMDIRPEMVPRLTISSMAAPIIEGTDVRHFFLYVPEEVADKALEFVKNYRISTAGVRAFAVDEEGNIHIRPLETQGHAKDHRPT
jgi:hypothetical protein